MLFIFLRLIFLFPNLKIIMASKDSPAVKPRIFEDNDLHKAVKNDGKWGGWLYITQHLHL